MYYFLPTKKKRFSYSIKNLNPSTHCSNGSNSGNNLDLQQQTQIGRINSISMVNFFQIFIEFRHKPDLENHKSKKNSHFYSRSEKYM